MDAVAIIDQIVVLLGRLRAELVAAEVAPIGETSLATEDAGDFNENNLIEVTAAAERFSYPANTVRFWCRQGGDGIRRGGRWLVSVPRVQRRLNGGR